MRWLLRSFIAIVVVIACLALFLYTRYGGGKDFADRSTAPLLPASALEVVAALDDPPGNVAVSADGRVFITLHPEAKPEVNRVVEIVDGKAVPFPSAEAQQQLFVAPQGIRIDRQGRLWTIDHGDNGFSPARLIAIDIASRRVVHDHVFPRDVAPVLSYLQDLNVSPDGQTVYIADVAFFRQTPGLLIHDVASGSTRRVLDGHPAVLPEGYHVRTGDGIMSRIFGLVVLKPGLDTMALSVDGATLFIGPMTGGTLYRVSTADLLDTRLVADELARRVVPFAAKVLSDGASIDDAGNVYVTDVENSGVARISPDGRLQTVIKDPRVRWADGLSFGPDGWMYLADSAIPWIALKSRADVKAAAPYYVFRFKPGGSAPAGQ
jgi:sugar lactone lactonase YvrE